MWLARILRNQAPSVLSRFWAATAHLRFFAHPTDACFAPQPVSVDWRRVSSLKVLFEQCLAICWKRFAGVCLGLPDSHREGVGLNGITRRHPHVAAAGFGTFLELNFG